MEPLDPDALEQVRAALLARHDARRQVARLELAISDFVELRRIVPEPLKQEWAAASRALGAADARLREALYRGAEAFRRPRRVPLSAAADPSAASPPSGRGSSRKT